MDRHDLAPLARLMLVVYGLAFLYLLFSPSPPSPPGGSELPGHFLLFFGLGLLVACSMSEAGPVWRVRVVLLAGTLAALGTELVQGRLPTRMFEWSDLAANLLGTIAAAGMPVWPEAAGEDGVEGDHADVADDPAP